MEKKKKNGAGKLIWITSAVMAVILVSCGALVAKFLIADDEGKRRQIVHTVTLIKPPPPPPIKEKPPEPEVKKQEIVEEKKEAPREESKEAEDKPAGDQLGLDADGNAGSDAFGLLGKKGGRALLGGDYGSELMRRYAWYTAIIQEDLKRKVKKHLDNNGGIPTGKLEAIVSIVMDEDGSLSAFSLVGSSGNHSMDEAVKRALASVQISEVPPEGMPRSMKLKITSQG